MDERCFPNTFDDYNGDKSGFLTEEGNLTPDHVTKLQEKILNLVENLNQGLERHLDWHDYSVYTGTSGLALLFLHLKDVFKKDDYLKQAMHYLDRPLQQLKRKRLTFLCGDAGPLTLGVVIHAEMGNREKSLDCLERLLAMHSDVMRDPNFPDELLFGRAGYLWSIMYLQKQLGTEIVSTNLTEELYEKILESGRKLAKKEKSPCPLMYEWHEKKYLGAAHGLTGILYLLMQFTAEKYNKNLHELIRPTIDHLITMKYPSGNYPSSVGSGSGDKLVHWCHGAPGWIYMFLQAYKVFQDDAYLARALECGDVIWQRGLLKKGYSLCHGVAGNAYAFLGLYRVTEDVKHLYRAIKFAEWCMDYGRHDCREADRPMSLFEGLAGTIYFLSDLLDLERAKFPAFIL